MAKGDNYGLFKKIESQKNALRFIKDVSTWLLFLALAQTVLSVFVNPSAIFDAVIIGFCGFFLRKSHSLAAAITYLIVTIITLILVVAKKLGAEWGVDGWILMILLNFFISAKTVETILKLRKNQFAPESVDNITHMS